MGSNIPIQLTRFIGREREMGDVKRLLAETRLLTLTGPGGSGKTRLAIELTRRLETAYGGQFWVDLASISDPDLVAEVLGVTLGVPEQPGLSAIEALVEFLKEKKLLLLLDNCEHLIAACAELVRLLLQGCPEIRVLATSREPLALIGEDIYPVPALSFPAPGAMARISAIGMISAVDLQDLERHEAVTLFLDRASTVLPGFTLTAENARSISSICQRLDGMPLAIELAAARVNVLTTEQIADRLDDQITLLSTRIRADLPPRHQTLQATMDWSYDMLALDEQKVLRRLSVFEGDCTLEAAESICADTMVPASIIFELVVALVERSLLAAVTVGLDKARYGLPETIRVYARRKLVEAGEISPFRTRHLDYFMAQAEAIAPRLHDAHQQEWLNHLDQELNNYRGALRWAITNGLVVQGMRLVVALGQYWLKRGYLAEGQSWAQQLFDASTDEMPIPLRVETAVYAAFCAALRLDAEGARRSGEQAVLLAESTDDLHLQALAYSGFAGYYRAIGDHSNAYRLVKRGIDGFREVGDQLAVGIGLFNLAMHAIALGKYAEARQMLSESLEIARAANDPFRLAHTFITLGDLEQVLHNWMAAIEAYEHGQRIFAEVGSPRDVATTLHSLAHIYLQLGELTRARGLLGASVTTHKQLGNWHGVKATLLGYGVLASLLKEYESAVVLLTAEITLLKTAITSLSPAAEKTYGDTLAQARLKLSAGEYAAALARGKKLTLAEALSLAQSLSPHQADPAARLTPRQRQIVALIAAGKTNGEIAEMLVVSKRTVEKHMANILARLDLKHRAEVVRWGIEHGLTDEHNSGIQSNF